MKLLVMNFFPYLFDQIRWSEGRYERLWRFYRKSTG